MARMLGESVLPESVNSVRRNIRNRAMGLREPIRRRREQLVPGPDVIGQVESSVTDLRDQFVSREGLLDRVRSQDMMSGNGNSTDSQNSSSSDTTPAT